MSRGRRRVRAARRFDRGVRGLVWLALLAAIGWGLFVWARARPQDMPWTPLDLAQPAGMFTRGKLVALRDEPGQCKLLLERAGAQFEALPPRKDGAQCGYDDAVRLSRGGARTVGYAPANLGIACPVAAALSMWEWQVVQPAARRHFGQQVDTIEHFGSYNCRRMYGRDQGAWSEHATANAVDIAAFRLSDGTRVSIVSDWDGKGERGPAKAAFLREVRDGACDTFATVLSPDYNAAHRDHFHLDQADRGAMSWGACR